MSDAVTEVIESARSLIDEIAEVLRRDTLREGESAGEQARRQIVALSTMLGNVTANAVLNGVPVQVVSDECQAWHMLGAEFALHQHTKECPDGEACEYASELRKSLTATAEEMERRQQGQR